MKKIIALLLFVLAGTTSYAIQADSIGTKVKNGKVYILHQVEKGDGMYAISKRYNVPLAELIAENPGSESVIKIGQIIWVPTGEEATVEPRVEDFFDRTDSHQPKEAEPVKDSTSTFAVYHTVSKGETLFAIARKYNTSVHVIKDLNNLSSDVLSEGQKLLVPNEAGFVEVVPSIDQTIKDIQKDVNASQSVKDTQRIEVEGYSIKVVRLEEYNLEKVEETGTYLAAGDDIPSDKNFCYHFNAPIGTVIQVTNPVTNDAVFVKVIGNFDRQDSSSSIIILSDKSASAIGLKGSGASVNLSYARQ